MEYHYKRFVRLINNYCKKHNYKMKIKQKELIDKFDETFTELFEDCMGYYGDVVETMDETMDKNGYNFDIGILTYVRRTPYKPRKRILKGQEKLDV